jgi:sarcosine oxidase subunit alpha
MTAKLLHRPAKQVAVTVDGVEIRLPAGMMLASALATADVLRLRASPRAGTPRGAFCLMGACQECVLLVDGVLRQACMTPVAAGMRIERGSAP